MVMTDRNQILFYGKQGTCYGFLVCWEMGNGGWFLFKKEQRIRNQMEGKVRRIACPFFSVWTQQIMARFFGKQTWILRRFSRHSIVSGLFFSLDLVCQPQTARRVNVHRGLWERKGNGRP